MKNRIVFAGFTFAMILGFSGLLQAHGGKDVTITGQVVSAIIDDASGKAYVLKPAHKEEALPESIKIGQKATVYGDVSHKHGHLSIRVEKVQ